MFEGPYLVVITKRESVGQIRGHTIWKVAGTEILSYKKTTFHITERQVCLNSHNVLFRVACDVFWILILVHSFLLKLKFVSILVMNLSLLYTAVNVNVSRLLKFLLFSGSVELQVPVYD